MTFLYMLDTNMVSYIVKDHSKAARARLLALQNDSVAAVSAVTEAEICYRLAKKPEATALKTLMDGFLASIQVLPWVGPKPMPTGRLELRWSRVASV